VRRRIFIGFEFIPGGWLPLLLQRIDWGYDYGIVFIIPAAPEYKEDH